ncbi:MAG: hypothetical protein IKO82_01215 [Prevotella sp.]|nr:hypothetical protein [Prevotella sp.]
MKLTKMFLIAMLAVSWSAFAQSTYDQQKPFGFCTVSSRTQNTTYSITGGGCYTYPVTGVSSSKVITLSSTGSDMKNAIFDAIKNYSVIIFDGSNGDFIVSSSIGLSEIKNKTLLGINGAKLCTTWYATQEILAALDAAGVPSMSTSGGGGKLPNGTTVKEEAEYNTRKIIIEMTGDNDEKYRSSGVFSFSGCENIIIRNLKFQGPGSIDVGGADLVSFYGGTKHCWVDHCDFLDGMDGNFDITQKSDFNTVSWCTFDYTSRSYMHQNTNLIGSSDSETTGYLNTTFAFCHWGNGCRARMPMGRVGKIHMLNNYYTATKGGHCINPRINSEFLIEGNYFGKGVKNYYGQSGATAVTWKNTNYATEGGSVESFGTTVTVPYTYTVTDNNVIPTEVSTHAGATLYGSESGGDTGGDAPSDPEIPSLVEGNSYVIADGENVYNGKKITCDDITMTYGNDGQWSVVATNAMQNEGFSNLAGGNVNPVDDNGQRYASSKKVPTKGTFYIFSPTADGTLYIASYVFTNKKAFVTEDGTAQGFSAGGKTINSGNAISEGEYTGYIRFNVKKGSEYYLFGESTKIKIFGFNFVPESTAVSNITSTSSPYRPASASIYNLFGQCVNNNARGLVIDGGRKIIR